MELIIPGFSNVLHINHRIQSIATKFFIVRLVSVAVQGTLDAVFKVICIVAHEVEAIAFFGLVVILEHCVL